ncbi:hypothetical protein OPV22_006190 [Ensete ventricosum]|uniref:Uncharacterized protein n=1 Tax=Ensete ventricosum TaxID=4639 RepID=A0AAV8RP53_ENSVE|nr:hypothetical protein OPV22_006190 [Ensete ventricosum]
MFRSDGADAPPPSLSTFPFPSSPQPSFSTFVSQCSSPSLYVDRLVSSFPNLSRPPAPPPPLPSYDLWSPSYPAFSSRSAPPADAARRHGSYASLAPPPWGSAESRSNPALDFGPERPEWPRTPRFGRLDRTPSWLVDHSLASRPSSSYGAEEKPSIIQNAVENDVKLSKNRYNVDKYDDSSMNYSVMVNGSSASSDSTNGNNGDNSLGVMSGSMASDSKIFNSLCYRNRFCESDKSMPISSDPLDQYNLSATSARTGAPDYCRFPFRAGDHVYPSPILNNLEGCSHSDRGGYFLSANTKLEYSHFPEHVDSSNCPEYHNDDLGSFSVHRRGHLKSKNDKTGTSGDEEIGTMQHACIAYVLREQCGETGENMNVLGQQKSISQPVVSGEAADPQIGPNTAVQVEYRHPAEDFQLLPKTMLGLSEVLVSGGTVINLKKQDEELIQQVIDNLKSLINRGRKVDSDKKFSKNKNMKATIHGKEVGANNNNSNNYVPRDVDLKKALDMILWENHFKSEEESEMLFYKKHWLEAEIALSAVKFQLAQMKLEVEKGKPKLEENLDESSDVQQKPSRLYNLMNLNSMYNTIEHDEQSCQGNQSLCSYMEPLEISQRKADNVDASIMSTFRVTNALPDGLNSTTMAEHVKIHDSAEVEGWLGHGQTANGHHPNGGQTQESKFLPGHVESGFSRWNQQFHVDAEHEQSANDTVCRTPAEIPAYTAAEPGVLPAAYSTYASEAFADGSNNQLSEWEHITMEEATWYCQKTGN